LTLIRKYFKFPSFDFKKYAFKELAFIFILTAILIAVLTGLFIPSLLISASPQEFSFIDQYNTPLYFIFNTFLQSFGFFVFWLLCLYFLFSDKINLSASSSLPLRFFIILFKAIRYSFFLLQVIQWMNK
jgi:hypothetical protein